MTRYAYCLLAGIIIGYAARTIQYDLRRAARAQELARHRERTEGIDD